MTEDFESWAKEMKYELEKEKMGISKSQLIYINTHTQSAWQGWESALIFYGIQEGESK